MAAPKPTPSRPPEPAACRLAVAGDGTLTLPASLVADLGLAAGDAVEVAVLDGQAVLWRAADASKAGPDAPRLPDKAGAGSGGMESPRGMLRDDFKDREDIERFLDEERGKRPIESPRGLLRDYFTDWEDVKRFIEQERHGWTEREERLERLYRETRRNDTSTTS